MVFRRLSESSNVFKSTTCETLFLRDKEQFGHHGGGQGSYLYAQTLRVHGAHIAELHSCKAPGSDSFRGRVQSVVCMCVCVCVMQGVLGTVKNIPSGGAGRVGDRGEGWGSMRAVPRSSEKP